MKKILFALAIGLATLTSCESDLVNKPSVADGTLPISGDLLIKVVNTFDTGFTVTTDLIYEGNKLKSITTDDGSTDDFEYTDGLLTKQTHTWNGNSSVRTFEYDSNNRLEKRLNDGALVYTYTYNNDGTISKTENPGGSVTVLTFANDNLIKEEYTNTNAGVSSVITYTYDNKNNPLKSIHQSDVFALLGYYNANNVLVSATSGTAADDYDNSTTVYSSYNSNDYPLISTTVAAPGTMDQETTLAQYFYE